MLKINTDSLTERLQTGIAGMEHYGFLQVAADGIMLTAEPGGNIVLEKKENKVHIIYDTLPHFYMALGRVPGITDGRYPIVPETDRLGMMWDCSRNAVAKPETVKQQICSMLLAGYNYLSLYTEETYELPDEPYFGYKRGRYSREELTDIIDFADIFDFEMVPCIQVLAHLKNLANWKPYFDHMDIDDILLVGDERTYALIRKMLTYCKEVFHTDRINIGSDEAFRLGRGVYTDKNGYRTKHEIYLEHMQKVFAICKEVGLKPEFWADAFYDTDRPDEEVQAIFDGSQTPIYWEYSIAEKEPHIEKMRKLQGYAGKVTYAGGLWTWIGYAPDNRFTDKVTDAALDAALECGVRDILMTVWGDNGGECSVFAVLPSMWYAAGKVYPIQTDMNAILSVFTGYTDDEWRMCDRLNHVMPQLDKLSNSVKYLLSNDYLVGLLDANIPDHAGVFYEELYPEFLKLSERKSRFSYIYRAYAAMCKVLIHKATYSKRLYTAYQAQDREAMRDMIAELQIIRKDALELCDVFRAYWMQENKGVGYEVMDLRLGGCLVARADTVTQVLNDYLDKKTDRIYELEEERIEYFCGQLTGDEVYAPLHNMWSTAYTVNHL